MKRDRAAQAGDLTYFDRNIMAPPIQVLLLAVFVASVHCATTGVLPLISHRPTGGSHITYTNRRFYHDIVERNIGRAPTGPVAHAARAQRECDFCGAFVKEQLLACTRATEAADPSTERSVDELADVCRAVEQRDSCAAACTRGGVCSRCATPAVGTRDNRAMDPTPAPPCHTRAAQAP